MGMIGMVDPRDPVSPGAPPRPLPRLAGILLAAGESRRMGGADKLAILVDGEPLVRRTARTLIAAGIAPLIAVLGHAAERTAALLDGLPVMTVVNDGWREGQQASVRVGLAELARRLESAGVEGFVVSLSDLPLLRPDHLRELAAAFADRGPARVLVPWHAGRRGNPVLFEAALCAPLAAGQGGPRAWIDAHPEAVRRLAVDHPGCTTDLDTPQDVAGLAATPGAPRIELP
jgi:molybdenum cofactor cytidylyltransferase